MRSLARAVALLIVGFLLLVPPLAPQRVGAPASTSPQAGLPRLATAAISPGPQPLAASVSLNLTTSTPSADPKDVVVFYLYINNTGDQGAPDAWVNVTTPIGLSFVGDTAAGNLSGFPSYHFAPVNLGLHAFHMDFVVAIGTTPGTVLTLAASLVYADGTGIQHFVGPASASVSVGLETKPLYLGWSAAPPGILRPVPPSGGLLPAGIFPLTDGGSAVNFDLSAPLARAFRGRNASAVLYVQPLATPATLVLNLTLVDVNGPSTTPVASVEQVNTVTGSGYWTFFYTFPATDYVFAAGDRIRLQVINTAASTQSALLATNATSAASRIAFVTPTYVNVDSLTPPVSPAAYLSPKSTLVITANISDPFGSGEIVDARLNVTGPSGPIVSWLSLNPPAAVDPSTPSAWALFRYTRSPLLENGTYSIELSAIERNGVMSVAASSVLVRAPSFTLDKIASVAQAKSWQLFTYTIWYNNTGTGPAGTVWINDTLPSEVFFRSSSPSASSHTGNTYRWVATNASVGNHSIQIHVLVSGGLSGVGYIRNWASLNFTDERGFPWPSEMAFADVVINGPVLSLDAASLPSTFLHSGEPAVYTITMTNTGDVANSLWLNATLPSGLTYLNDTAASLGGTRTVSGNRIDFVFTNMRSGSTTPVVWSFTLTEQARAGLASGTDLGSTIALNATSANDLLMPEQAVAVPLVAAAPVIAAAGASFGMPTASIASPLPLYVNFTNGGNEPARRVWVNVSLDPFLRFASSPVPATANNTTVQLTFANASAGPDSVPLFVTALPSVGSQRLLDRQILTVAGTLAFSDGYGNLFAPLIVAPESVVVALPDVGFSLSPTSRQAEAGTVLQYSITGGNSGSGTARAVWLNLTLPASLTYQGDTFGVQPSVLGSTYSWAWSNYGPGGHAALLTLLANGLAADNTSADLAFNVQALDRGGYPAPPSTFGGTVGYLAPAWRLSISANRDTSLAAGEINYTLRVQNVGETAAHYLWLLLPLDPNLQVITHTAPVPATGTSILNWTFRDVQPGQSFVFNVLARVAPGTPANTAIAAALEAHYTNSAGAVLGYVRSAAAQVEVQADLMPLLYILIGGSIAGAGVVFVVYRRYRVQIEDVFLIGHDGILIAHLAQTTSQDKDEDQLSGMLTAVQDFVQDAFAYGGHRELDELEFGDYHVLIERGDHVYLAVVYVGRDSGLIRKKVRAVLDKIESSYGAVFATWDGDMTPVEGTRELLVQGFQEEDHPWSLVKSRGP